MSFLFASNRLSALSKGFSNSLVDGIAQSTLAVVWNDVWLFDCFDKKIVLGIHYLILNL